MILRPYQDKALIELYAGWLGALNGLVVSPTGSGKTVLFAKALSNHQGHSVAIAHRQELVGQMSRTLGSYGIRHRIIAPSNVVRNIVSTHIQKFGRDFYDPQAPCAVAGVGTLVSRADKLAHWANQVTLWVLDESHHLIKNNQWGKAVAMFPNARGLGVTATPERADGKGLGRHADGLFDFMVEGPGMRDLITAGYLTEYRIFCPPSDLDLSSVATGADGDYVRGQLALKTQKSTVMGHVVDHYLRIAPGALGITFAPDVETATQFSAMFNQAGVPAEVVTAQTPDKMRVEIMRRFERRELLQLVNVDLFGEGVDIPAVEVVTMARATQSYGLYIQQFGRALRLLEGKERAIIIDHVGNVLRHGLPDRPRTWTLDRKEKRSGSKTDDGLIPLRNCLNPICLAPYEAVYPACPFCGWVPVPAGRTAPEMVDGDLCELDAETLAAMRGEIERIDRHPDAVMRGLQMAGKPYPVAKGAANQHEERQRAQTVLREAISWYGGWRRYLGEPDRVLHRRFYHTFGVDILTAQTLGRADAEALAARVNSAMGRVSA